MNEIKQKKRILIFSLVYYPRFIGGAEIAIKEITDRIAPEEIEFDMITLRLDSSSPKSEQIGNIQVYRIGPGKKNVTLEELARFPWYLVKVAYPILAFFRAVQLYRTRRYDALWSIMTYMGFPAVLFKMFRKPGIPFILTLQDGDSPKHILERKRVKIFSPLLRRVFKQASQIQAISHYLANFAKERGYRGEVQVVPNGVNVEAFSVKRLADREEIRNKLGINKDDNVLITTSRLVEKNAVGDIIKSLKYLPENVKLIIIGAGPLEFDLKLYAKRFTLNARVRFIGFIPHSELPVYLHISDIFVRPSLSEGFGSSFIEAMAAGIPVIATPVGGITDFLFDPFMNKDKLPTGLFCDVKDPENLAEKIRLLLDNNELRDRIVKNASDMVSKKYDWNLVAQNMNKIILDTI